MTTTRKPVTGAELRSMAHRIEAAANELERKCGMPAYARKMREDAARLRSLAPKS